MQLLVKYVLSDGAIMQAWAGNPVEMLTAQIPAEDTGHGYVIVETDVDLRQLPGDYYINAETLTPKGLLTITASPNPFSANSTTLCHVTVSPFVPCTLVVDGTSLVVSAGDPTVGLTADVPHTFAVSLAPMATYRAEPITVEAL